MNEFFILELPAFGRIADGSLWDRSGERPLVMKLNYVFDYKPDSELFETFPVYISSKRLAESLLEQGFTGFQIGDMTVSISDTFRHFNPHQTKPSDYVWFKVSGRQQIDDFGVNPEFRLVVSKKAYDYLQKFQFREALKYDVDAPPRPGQVEDDLFESMRRSMRK